jgi:hypothetical protein
MSLKLFLTLILLALPVCVTTVHSQQPLLTPAPGSPAAVGEGSGRVVLVDVNRDGRLDLVTQHLQGRFVAVHLGDGEGRFATAPGSPMKLAYSPGEIKLGDVNNDGMLDLGVTSSERDTVDIFLGNGSGRFNPAPGSPFLASASTELNTHGLQLADINRDGKLDIITTSNQLNTFATLFGDGRGGFSPGPPTTFPAGEGRYSFGFGDLDGDGHLDAAIANGYSDDIPEPGRVVVMRGDGKGAFKLLSETQTLSGPRWLTLGDMNNDRRPDLVLSHNTNQMSVLLNQGGGRFTPGSTYDLETDAFAVAVADINRDNRNDLVVATVNSVTVLLNGKSGFEPAPGSPFRAGPGAYHIGTGDVNRDGRPDVVASSFEGKAVTVLLGQ